MRVCSSLSGGGGGGGGGGDEVRGEEEGERAREGDRGRVRESERETEGEEGERVRGGKRTGIVAHHHCFIALSFTCTCIMSAVTVSTSFVTTHSLITCTTMNGKARLPWQPLTCIFLGFFSGDCAQVTKVTLVTYQHDDNVGVGMVTQFLQPSFHVLICQVFGDVIH